MILPSLFLYLSGGVFTLLALSMLVVSLQEREQRAAGIAGALTILGAVWLLGVGMLPESTQIILAGGLAAAVLLLIAAFLIPGKSQPVGPNQPDFQVDERTIMFARSRLEPGSQESEAYYQDHPDHFQEDQKTRQKPGLLSPEARLTDPLTSAATGASFFLTEALRDAVDGPAAEEPFQPKPGQLTVYVKELAHYYGALDTGITPLKKAHIYSHIGRGTGTYGAPIQLDHNWAVAFTVEMDFQQTATAPYPTLTMESGRQYVESARIAVQLAAALRALGYPSRAHIDGNYRVIAPLVARDAGLGELGRMGLLMTPRQGPRVRLGVVTTTAPLQADTYHPDRSLLDFCTLCRRCAELCPSQSIPHGPRELDQHVLRWKINPDTCYRYWNVVGTDCGRCLAVCPYSHPDNWLHNLVRWGIRRSPAFRRAALQLEIFFYGKNPSPKTPGPDFQSLNSPQQSSPESDL